MISLICTTYNRTEYLTETIESVLAQTYQNWELLIVDDGSDSRYLVELNRILNCYSDQRIRLFFADRLGRSKQLYEAHRLCRGEFIGWVDDDDKFLNPDTLAVCITQLINSVSMVFTNCKNHSSSNREYQQFTSNLVNFDCFHFRLFRLSDWHKFGGYNVELEYANDWDLSLRLEELGMVKKISSLDYFYRLHSNRISVRENKQQTIDAITAVSDALKRRGDSRSLVVKDNIWRLI
jgi:glycosyltransferase involved in cell wall biosynthesis